MEENIIQNTTDNKDKAVGQKQIAGAIVIAGVIIAGAILLKGNSTLVSPEGKKLITNAKMFNECLDSDRYAQAVADSNISGNEAGVNGTPKGFILKDGKVVATIDGAEPTATVKQKIDAALTGTSRAIENIKLDPISSTDFFMGDIGASVSVIEYADFQCPFCGKFFRETKKTLIDDYVADRKINFAYRDYAFLGTESIQASEAARCAAEQGKFWEYHDYLYSHQNGENQGAFSDLYLKSFAGELKLK